MIAWLSQEETRGLVWGLMARGVSLVFVVHLLSFGPQLLPLIGRKGLMPVSLHLAALKRDLPLWARLRHSPGLLWLAHSDRALVGWWLLALCGAALGVIGGPLAVPGQAVAWGVALSFRGVGRLSMPWDFVLLEVGALAIFLPGRPWLPDLSLSALPTPLVCFAFHLEIFRVVFGFGSSKFFGARARDRYFSKYVVEYEMLPTPLSWFIAKLPDPLHVASLGLMVITELVGPTLVLFPGPLRLVGGALVLTQMVLIQSVGNYGHFNVLVSVLCLSALDPVASPMLAFAGGAGLPLTQIPIALLLAVTLILLPVSSIFNGWTANWARWPAFERLPWPARALAALARAIEPLELVHSLGAFTPQPGAPAHFAGVLQGRVGDGPWKTWPWRWALTDEDSRPAFIAPRHPRLDHGVWFDTLNIDGTGWMHPTIFGDPYQLTAPSHQEQLMQRLMEPEATPRRLLGPDPFGGARPTEMRIALFRGRYTSWAQRRATGRLWVMQAVGEHLPPRGPRPDLWDTWRPPVELWHPETPGWRRAARPAEPVSAAALAAVEGALLPQIRALALEQGPSPWQWAHLPAVARALQRRYSRAELYALHRVVNRMALVSQVRLEALLWHPSPHWLRDVVGVRVGAPAPRLADLPADAGLPQLRRALTAWPTGPLWSLLRLGLLPRWALLSDVQTWRALGGAQLVLDAPIPTRVPRSDDPAALGVDLGALRAAAADFDLARGLFLDGALHYALLSHQAARLDLFQAFTGPLTAPATGLAPGAVELCAALAEQHAALPRWADWGGEGAPSPTHAYTKMVYDQDGQWRERS